MFLITDIPLQFDKYPSASVGRIKVYHSSSSKPVCRHKWGKYESRALCEVLGYSYTEGEAGENTTNCAKNNTAAQECISADTLAANCSVEEEVPVIKCKGT